LPYDF